LLPLLPDLRACWRWSVATADAELISALDGPLYRLLRETALREGAALYEIAWEQLQIVWQENGRTLPQQTALAHLATHLGFFRLFCGDAYGARPCLEYALSELDRLHITTGRNTALAALADTLSILGQYEAAAALWQQELRTVDANANSPHLSLFLCNLGEILYHMGRLEEAQEALLRALEMDVADEPDYNVAIVLNNLGLTEVALGNFARARVLLEQSLRIRQQYTNAYRIASARRALGLLAVAEGDFARAWQQLREAQQLYEESGRLDGLGPVHVGLARAAMGEGDWETAEQQIQQALASAVQLRHVAHGLDGLWRWGELLWRVGRCDDALRLLGYVLHHSNASGFLVREIKTFLAAQQISVELLQPLDDVDWQWWVQQNPWVHV
ncbi:MAG: tetratricopeptide repeat protein, partial [Anaerolineales bacterium]|nr:tetratricopeptide repeat protein [Anaerolineales bacterium]